MQLSCAAPRPSYIELPIAIRTRTAVDWPIQVLLVEDNADAAWLVEFCLTGEGEQFRIEWASDLLQAMTRLAQPGIEVVLLDLGLPELDGYKSFRAIDAAADGKIPVVILTSDDSRDSRDLTLGYGASDYLIKDSISPARLRAALVDAVQSGRH
jgi:two-component system catabolic regulation response regulator CreB